MDPDGWDACSWDLQRTYWAGLVAEGLVKEGEQQESAPPIATRQADSGADVIDMQAFVRDAQAS